MKSVKKIFRSLNRKVLFEFVLFLILFGLNLFTIFLFVVALDNIKNTTFSLQTPTKYSSDTQVIVSLEEGGVLDETNVNLFVENFTLSLNSLLELKSEEYQDIGLYTEEQTEIDFACEDFLTLLPSFLKCSDSKLRSNPQKSDSGKYMLPFRDGNNISYLNIRVSPKSVDFEELRNLITQFLSNKRGEYGLYLKDFLRDQEITINGKQEFIPASMAKVPLAILVLKDIDAGLFSLDTTIPVDPKYRFGSVDSIGRLRNGTMVPIRRYLEEMIMESSNTAWLHLFAFMGGYEWTVTERTVKELGVNPFFLDPYLVNADSAGKLFSNLYNQVYLTKQSNDFLLNLMKNAVAWAKQGVGSRLSGVTYANKIGINFTGAKYNYVDGAIVWGAKTDYLLVVLNDDVPWDYGAQVLGELGLIIYNFLNK